jgi:hypothetical protein
LATPVPPSPGPFPDRLPASPGSGRRCGSFVPLPFFPRRCSARPGPLRPGLPPAASRPGPHPKTRSDPIPQSLGAPTRPSGRLPAFHAPAPASDVRSAAVPGPARRLPPKPERSDRAPHVGLSSLPLRYLNVKDRVAGERSSPSRPVRRPVFQANDIIPRSGFRSTPS